MSDHLPVLKVRLFGGFSASYGEIPVSFGRNTTTKAMKLLQILLYHGDNGISRDKLLDELYGREELADAANNLRVTAHRLKKIIVDAGLPSHDYINIKKGISDGMLRCRPKLMHISLRFCQKTCMRVPIR